jgi:hypothetical protein
MMELPDAALQQNFPSGRNAFHIMTSSLQVIDLQQKAF